MIGQLEHWNQVSTRHPKNTLALPIDKMLCIYLLCPHSEHQNNPFQSKQFKLFHKRNWFTLCETGSNKVKLPKVGSNAIVPVPVGAGPNGDFVRPSST
jgi:hypothetical protein